MTPAEAFQEDEGYAHRQMLAMIVRGFSGAAIAVMGDPMLDYYHFGHVNRLSPEAPVPVFIEDKVNLRDGGAANVAANLSALGCQVLQIFPTSPWTMKHRYLVGSQQLFRIDSDRNHSGCLDWGRQQGGLELKDCQALVISDYARGWCTAERCAYHLAGAEALGIPVVVDPKGVEWAKYAGATVICPNHLELEERRRFDFTRNSPHTTFHTILEKRGADGMRLARFDPISNLVVEDYFPARARHVFDVTGAGDTVTAVVAAALAVRCEMPIAAELANIAAGIVVGEVGTTPCSAALLLRELEG